MVERGLADRAHWLGDLVDLLGRRSRAPEDGAHLLAVQVFGEEGHRGHGQKGEEARYILGCLGDELPISFHYLLLKPQLNEIELERNGRIAVSFAAVPDLAAV